jgi:hypothetical protein
MDIWVFLSGGKEFFCDRPLIAELLNTSFEKAIDTPILFHQNFICGEQQNMQCAVIAHARLMS